MYRPILLFSEGKLTELKLALGIEFSGKLVGEKGLLIEVSRKSFIITNEGFFLEVKGLLGDELGIRRTVAQVITEIAHRIDCELPCIRG